MARLGSIEKMGYYPLPPISQERLSFLLIAQPGAYLRFYDPCAGQGEALRFLADRLRTAHQARVTTYGIEISAPRAQKAAQVLDQVLQADCEAVRVANEAFSFLICNPPYDLEGANEEHLRRNRLEYTFLRNCLSRLQIGGLLMYIVPQPILARENVAKFLSAHLDRITVYKFPPEEFAMFDQIALLAYRKEQAPPNPAEIERIIALGKGIKKLPTIPSPGEHTQRVPASGREPWEIPSATLPDKDVTFQRHHLTDDDILAMYQTQNAFQNDAWRTFVSPPPPTHFTPLTPLRPRHIAALISSGQVGTVRLPDPKQPNNHLLAKGITVKVVHTEEDQEKSQNKRGRMVVAEIEDYQTTIYTLNQQGEHQTLSTIPQIDEFLKQHGDPLAQLLDQRYRSLYQSPTRAEWEQVSALVPFQRLPGRNEAGLLPAQCHTAIAVKHSARRYGWADLIGEMGVGKSKIALAGIDLLGAYPAWVMAPTHTLANWQQEVTDTIPGAKGHIIRTLGDLVRFVRNYRPGYKWFAIFSIETAKLGPGWRTATVIRHRRVRHTDENGKTTSYIAKFHCCPKCGQPAWQAPDKRSTQEVSNEDLNYQKTRQYCTAPRRRWQGDPAGDNSKGEWTTSEMVDITEAGDDAKTLKRQNLHCGEPLFIFEGFRRWPLADYIHDHLPNFFQGGIADEYHKCGSKSTDAARAYHHLVDSTRYLINLTGTLFNGYASSLFWLRYRLDKQVRLDFDFHSEQRWSQLYGRIERLVADEAEWSEDGAFSGTHRYTINVRELPGVSPLIYRRLLQTTVFLSIENLGYQLPPYEEATVFLDMTKAQEADYDRLNDTLMKTIREGRKQYADEWERRRAQALLGVWLQNCLGRPNSGFRQEIVKWKPPGATQHIPFTIPVQRPAGEQLPDESLSITNTEQWTLADHIVHGLTGELPQAALPAAPLLLPELVEAEDDLSLPDNQPDEPVKGDQLEYSNFTDPLQEKLSPTVDNFSGVPSGPQQSTTTTVHLPFILPPVIKGHELLPKEEWLLDYATTEIQHNRKILLYVRQTGTRNIQPRLVDVLSRANLRALILPDNVEAIKREAWIKCQMQLLDLLSTNPKRVETGLNLTQFSTIIFFEIDYSLFTLMQAMRRVWRLGQTRPVKVLFPIYRNTLEEAAFWLMSDKMAAARLLYGDNATGAFAGGSNDLGGSILKELSRRIISNQLIQSNGIASLLSVNNQQTSEWATIATPAIQVPTLATNSNGYHNGNDTQRGPRGNPDSPADTSQLFDDAFTSLFATITNAREKKQRDAGQIGLFA